MSLPHRIAAGGIVVHQGKILLVRYPDKKMGSYLVAPGGGLESEENIEQAIRREVLEETGLEVEPTNIVMVEDLLCSRFKMCKIWMTCELVGGKLRKTRGAIKEGIIQVGWYRKEDLIEEIVFPNILIDQDWKAILNCNRVTISPTRRASF